MAEKSFNANRFSEKQSLVINFNNYVFGGSDFAGPAIGTIIYAGNPNSCSCGACCYLCCGACYPGCCFVPVTWFGGQCGYSHINTRCYCIGAPARGLANACGDERMSATSCWTPLITLAGEMIGPVIRVK